MSSVEQLKTILISAYKDLDAQKIAIDTESQQTGFFGFSVIKTLQRTCTADVTLYCVVSSYSLFSFLHRWHRSSK